jgi:hypothetical protein
MDSSSRRFATVQRRASREETRRYPPSARRNLRFASECAGVADAPDGIVLRRHRDLIGRRWQVWVRRGLLGLVLLVALLALLDVFGQRPSTTSAAAAAATLRVDSPGSVRGGLLYQVRFTIETHQDLKNATLVLDTGWFDGLTVNTIEPGPVNEASRDGKLALELGHLPSGAKHVLFIDYQVNPTTVGTRTQTVALDDGETPILSIDHDLTIFP